MAGTAYGGTVVRGALLLIGFGFLIANVQLIAEYLRYLKRRHRALLTWPGPKPPYYGTQLAIGIAIGILLFYKVVVLHR